jgi:hypothetical protein
LAGLAAKSAQFSEAAATGLKYAQPLKYENGLPIIEKAIHAVPKF